MWKSRKEDERPNTPSPQPAASVAPPIVPTQAPIKKEIAPMETPKPENFRADVAHIGKSVLVKGELSGSEDLYLDGEVEGSIELRGHSLTIGPHGRVHANVHARDVVVHGKVEGNIRGTDRVELKKSAILMGDIFTQRIVIEEGAFFKGGIDIQKDGAKADAKAESKPEIKPEPKREVVAAAASSSYSSGSTAGVTSPSPASAAPVSHSPMVESKKY
jgi:cytoskeletal protein CcmA (bactofilin family)